MERVPKAREELQFRGKLPNEERIDGMSREMVLADIRSITPLSTKPIIGRHIMHSVAISHKHKFQFLSL